MLKGEPEEKMMLCFKLCKPTAEAESVGRQDMIKMLVWPPAAARAARGRADALH